MVKPFYLGGSVIEQRNLMLPGNPRYQPKSMIPVWGYDNLFQAVALVEIATLETLHLYGLISDEEIALLTPEVKQNLLAITTSQVDKMEREVTKHDIRAWVRLAQEVLPEPLRRWIHVPLTSHDALDTGRALQFKETHRILHDELHRVVEQFIALIERTKHIGQIGRTHGQHAIPITVGFWLAGILHRIITCARRMDTAVENLVGKISGPVGAYNAQVTIGLFAHRNPGQTTFEQDVLYRLDLRPARISTQIVPPESLATYLSACVLLSAAFGQFGRDCRHLMRSEVGEIFEAKESGQVGSSTMAHKRNPINFENLEGTWLKTRAEYGKVLDTLVSDHQRDLVGSSLMRDFPIIPINLAQQMGTLLRKDKQGRTFLERLGIDELRCRENLMQSANLLVAEPLYILLQMNDYPGDAHALINDVVVPRAQQDNMTLLDALRYEGSGDASIECALERLNDDELLALTDPIEHYIGRAFEKSKEIIRFAQQYLKT